MVSIGSALPGIEMTISFTILIATLMLLFVACSGDDYDPRSDEYFGADAKQHLELAWIGNNPISIDDVWVFDGGSFNGTIHYASFECESQSDCWNAIAALDAPESGLFYDRVKPHSASTRLGPTHYWPDFKATHWDIDQVKNGYSFELRDGQRFQFWAVDTDRNRVYYHRESG